MISVKFIGMIAPIGSLVEEIMYNLGKKIEKVGKTVTYQKKGSLWERFDTEYVVIMFNLEEKCVIEELKKKGPTYLYTHSPFWSGRTSKKYVTIMDTNWLAWCIYNKMKKGVEGNCLIDDEKKMFPFYKNELSIVCTKIPLVSREYNAVDVSFKGITSLDSSIKIGKATLEKIKEASDLVEGIIGNNKSFILTISNRIFLNLTSVQGPIGRGYT
jgi:hypothetical protein